MQIFSQEAASLTSLSSDLCCCPIPTVRFLDSFLRPSLPLTLPLRTHHISIIVTRNRQHCRSPSTHRHDLGILSASSYGPPLRLLFVTGIIPGAPAIGTCGNLYPPGSPMGLCLDPPRTPTVNLTLEFATSLHILPRGCFLSRCASWRRSCR